ncbi:uncharacterized protein RHO25_013141 [Cercospora beticola]|uniref:MYND-type domain-containing protein n=1 Tax=Cercospora beticola TaxID=122368 RepID=A0ABZ0PAA8_CERBT|nr:hypothetical protein RHO25_013141 [Cercospora beticola]
MDCGTSLPDPRFGLPLEVFGREIMLARTEYMHLENSYAHDFLTYIRVELEDVRRLVIASVIAAAKALASVNVTLKAFAMYFKQLRARKIVDLGVRGKDHAMDAPNIGPHSCSKCKWALYCSKECQKKDWPAHKVICKPKEQFAQLLNKTVGKDMSDKLPESMSFGMWMEDTYLEGAD